ncbi:MAG TPA: MFS transporter [Candidatus Bathyarchaeia archaeon]|nr:MFS transporter [Candidatus Bathyarchaeia archaeon]
MPSNFLRILPIYLVLLLWMILWTASVGGPVMPLYVQSLGVSIAGWSILATALALGMFFFESSWGTLSDRVDRRFLIFFGMLAMSLLFPLYTIHFLVPYFVVMQFFAGAIGVILGPTTRVYVLDKAPPKYIGLFTSMWWAFYSVGGIVGPLVGTHLANSCSFNCAFYASTVLALVLGGLVMFTFPKLKRSTIPHKTPSLKSILRSRSSGYLFMSAAFAFMTISLMRSFLPLYASQLIKMSTVQVGVLISATFAVQLVTVPLIGWLGDKYGRRRMAIIGFTTSAIVFLSFLLVKTPSQLLLVSGIVSVGISASSLLLLGVIPEVTSDKFYGTAVGVYGAFEDLGGIFGPLIFGLVWTALSPVAIFAVGSVTQLIGAVLIFAIKPQRKP